MEELTTEQKEQYLSGWMRCPICQCEDIRAEDAGETIDNKMTQQISCYDCGASWIDIYTLMDIELVNRRRR